MSRKPRKRSGSSNGRINHNDFKIFASDLGSFRTSAGQSLMAINTLRHRGRVVGVGFAKESRPDSLLPLVSSVGEISNSFFFAGRDGQQSTMATRLRRVETEIIFYDRGVQPALYAASDFYHFSERSGNSLTDYAPFASSASRSGVARRILGCPFRMVPALAADMRGSTRSGGHAGRTRSGSPASTGASCGNAQAD